MCRSHASMEAYSEASNLCVERPTTAQVNGAGFQRPRTGNARAFRVCADAGVCWARLRLHSLRFRTVAPPIARDAPSRTSMEGLAPSPQRPTRRRVCVMAKASAFGEGSGLTKELREGVASAFDTLSQWRDGIDAVNERYLNKVLDQTSDVARSMGWPEEVIGATRKHLMSISKAQTDMIDQVMDSWKHQLSSATSPMSIPPGFSRGMRGITSPFAGALPQFNPLEPWTFWFETAELWQSMWVAAAPRGDGRRH